VIKLHKRCYAKCDRVPNKFKVICYLATDTCGSR